MASVSQQMRPQIDIPRQLDGRIKDLADEHDRDWRETYIEIIRRGADDLEAELGRPDTLAPLED